MTRRPANRLLGVGLALVLTSVTLGFAAGNLIKSPAQALADAAPPRPSTLTAPVTREAVRRTVAFDAVVTPQFQTVVRAQQATGVDANVLTRLGRREGSTVAAGDLLAEISGRPLIVVRGNIPMYRTMAPGMTGPDVRQLQFALGSAGHWTNDARGVFGPSTSQAVAALYEEHGYQPQRVGDEEVEVAEEAVRSAARNLTQLRQSKSDPLSLQFAQEDLARAQAAAGEAYTKAGAQVVLGELVFVPDLPARVSDVSVQVGDVVEDKVLTLASGPLVVRGTATSADAERIRLGDRAQTLFSPSGSGRGRVLRASRPVAAAGEGAAESDQAGTTFVIRPVKPLSARWLGADARVIVETARSEGVGYTVPVSAVSTAADGTTLVHVVSEGESRPVEVMVGFAGDGYVRVTASERGTLQVGDAVVVGTDSGSA